MPQNDLTRIAAVAWFKAVAVPFAAAQSDGFLHTGSAALFPIGCYELPEDDTALQAMTAAGFNVVHCHSRADLDRVQAVGILGVVPLPLQEGATDALRERVAAMADHPALAVWEGPDEVVWNFTGYSGLFKKLEVHKTKDAWWTQAPEAVAYAREKAAEIIPNMRAAVDMIRSIEPARRPVWINEAQKSDVFYVRQYLDYVDITGCDIYPVKWDKADIAAMGRTTDRWNEVGRGKPVWMVVQGFSWHELGEYYAAPEAAYPTFDQSRFMAWDCIAHGARGIFYWGTRFLTNETFRQSMYAVTSELAALQPFLTAPDVDGVALDLVGSPEERQSASMRHIVRRAGDDWLIVLVNEGDERHMGVVITGLDALGSRSLPVLYSDEEIPVAHGELIARMQPKEVKVISTDRRFETDRREGRYYAGE